LDQGDRPIPNFRKVSLELLVNRPKSGRLICVELHDLADYL
jgi:hypothetical protein